MIPIRTNKVKERTVVTGGVHDARPAEETVSILTLRATRTRTLTAQTVLLTSDNQKKYTQTLSHKSPLKYK